MASLWASREFSLFSVLPLVFYAWSKPTEEGGLTPCGGQEFLAEFSLSCPGHPQPLEAEISESLRWISLHSLVPHCTLNKRPLPSVKTHGKRLADRQRLALWGVEGTISILICHSAYMQLWQARLSPPYLHPWLILCLPSDILQIRSATGPWFLHSLLQFGSYPSLCLPSSLMGFLKLWFHSLSGLFWLLGWELTVFSLFLHPHFSPPLPPIHSSMLCVCIYTQMYIKYFPLMSNTVSCISFPFLYIPKLSKAVCPYCILYM